MTIRRENPENLETTGNLTRQGNFGEL